MSDPLPTPNSAPLSVPLPVSLPVPGSPDNSTTSFARSPQRDYMAFGSMGRPGVFLGSSLPRRSSLAASLSTEERRQLLREEEDLLVDNKLLKTISGSKSHLTPGSYGSIEQGDVITFMNGDVMTIPAVHRDDMCSDDEAVIKTTWDQALAQGTIQTSYKREFSVLLKNTLPVSVTFLLQYSLTVVSVFCVGHIGKNELSAVSLAGMVANICGYGIVQGIATSLDTLGAQAFGRSDREMVGIYTQRCALIMAVVLVPIILLWCNAKPFLLLFVPQVECCELAALYLRVLAVGIPPYVVFELAKHYLQAQGIFHASTYVLLFCAPANVVLNYTLVYNETIGVGFVGAPIAVVITDYFMAFIVLWYIIYVDGIQCWYGWSKDALKNLTYMSHLSLSGVITIEAEWLAFEVLTFAAAHLGTTELATQTVLATMCVLTYQIPLSMGIAASTRVGNLVGAGLGKSASIACNTAIYAALIFGVVNAVILFSARSSVGALFSSDADVIAMVAVVLPYGAMYQVNDALAAVTGGLLRGQGRQRISGYVNLTLYYVFALPLGLYLAFGRAWGLAGLWSGICFALVFVSLLQILFVVYADWDEIIQKAKEEIARDEMEVV